MDLERFTPDQHAEALRTLQESDLAELKLCFITVVNSSLGLEDNRQLVLDDIPELRVFRFAQYMESLAAAEPENTLFALLYGTMAVSGEGFARMMASNTDALADDTPTLVKLSELNETDQHAFSIARNNISELFKHAFLGRSTDKILGLLRYEVVTETDGKYCRGIFNYTYDQLSRDAIHEKYSAMQAQAESIGLSNLRFGLNVQTKTITISQKISA